ncbi:hypothetical protein SEA_HIRKO_46 [Arthrobacter phage Hirko]|nr:hypothetical protein SEA_HIRKO_46 [Arthrobacter phage Hirko]
MSIATDYPALNYGTVTQAHADYCAEHGHATYTNGTDVSPWCPRCGQSTTAKPVTPIHMTAEAAATKAYQFVAAKAGNEGKTPEQLRPEARELLTGMIRKGAFVITD